MCFSCELTTCKVTTHCSLSKNEGWQACYIKKKKKKKKKKQESTWGDTGEWTHGSNPVLEFSPNFLLCLKHPLANMIQMSVLLRETGECLAWEIPEWFLVKMHAQA